MTKKSVIERNLKRIILVNKYYKTRLNLKKKISSSKITNKERWKYIIKLQSMSKDTSYIRIRNRCSLTGRPRGCLSKFGLSRIKFREFISRGEIPGVKKSSW